MLLDSGVNNINFSARFVRSVPILKKDTIGLYQPYKAKLIEFDLKQDNDKIRELCYGKAFLSLGSRLYKDLNSDCYCGSKIKKHCYALLAEDEKNINNPKTSNVLGLFTLNEDKTAQKLHNIRYFMTNYKYRSENSDKQKLFKGIGKGMVDALKKMFPTDSFHGDSAVYATGFWKKNGFESAGGRHLIYKGKPENIQ